MLVPLLIRLCFTSVLLALTLFAVFVSDSRTVNSGAAMVIVGLTMLAFRGLTRPMPDTEVLLYFSSMMGLISGALPLAAALLFPEACSASGFSFTATAWLVGAVCGYGMTALLAFRFRPDGEDRPILRPFFCLWLPFAVGSGAVALFGMSAEPCAENGGNTLLIVGPLSNAVAAVILGYHIRGTSPERLLDL